MPLRSLIRLAAVFAAAFVSSLPAVLAADAPAPGLTLTLTAGAVTDLSIADNLWLHVSAGQPASPWIPAGGFAAKWEGQITAELRADYTFHAEYSGTLKLTINDTVAIEAPGTGDAPVPGKTVRLNKGANTLIAEYTPPASGDAFLRVFWSNKETPYTPIPFSALTHSASPELAKSLLTHRGRDLFIENRCARCHTVPQGIAELAMDAPAFAGIGSRRNHDWLARWIQDPQAMRPGTPMPAVFHGAEGAEQSKAVAAFLSSLKAGATPSATAGNAAEGKALYEKLHCAACHNPPDATEQDAKKIGQKQVVAKFAPGALPAFLQKPSEHYAWIRMPNFRLTAEEAGNLAAYLEANADKAAAGTAPTDETLISRGRVLVQNSGCLNCHALDLQNQFAARPLSSLATDHWNAGCVAEAPAEASKSPRYAFTAEDRQALRAFAASDRRSLTRQTSVDFLARQTERLNCRECHGKVEGFPAFELLPGKLKPEWAARFIAGNESWKPRTWLEARMPGFPAFAEGLATGLSQVAGLPPKSPEDPAPADTAELAKAGQKIAGANGGFSCISCHGIADFAATQVFEAPGINLAHSFARLQKPYFRRWLRAPTSVDPSTKMPVYFDEEGKSPLPDILGGDGPKTIGAVWEYLRLGDKMQKPE
jgi:mono/diheme cytochrome c family protein